LTLLRTDTNGIVTYHFESLDVEGLVHAVFTRLGGVSQGPFASLNVGNTVGDDEMAVAENHARVYARLGLSADRVATPRQVHGNRVATVTAGDAGRVFSNTDGLATDTPGLALMLRFADCQPILLYDPAHHALGLVHAGWRGVAQGIARRGVETMREAFGTHPQDLVAGLGPAIGPDCYTVGQNVAAAMSYALPDWSQVMILQGEDTWRLDLSGANTQQLAAAGVRTIEQSHLCTACRRDEFYSHRGDNGRTGRFAVVAFLEPRAGVPVYRETATFRAESDREESTPPASLDPPGFPAFGEQMGGDR
jgi:YfiH family protein